MGKGKEASSRIEGVGMAVTGMVSETIDSSEIGEGTGKRILKGVMKKINL